MPLHTPTILAARRSRLARAAALAAATCATAGAATVVIADDQPAPQVRTIAEPSQPATRYFDEVTKVASMRALSRHIAEPTGGARGTRGSCPAACSERAARQP